MEDNWTPPSDAEVTDWTPPSDAQVADEPVKKKVIPSPSQTQSSVGALDVLSGVNPSAKKLLSQPLEVQKETKIDLTNAPIAEDESTRTDKFIRKPIDKKKVDEIYTLSKQNESLVDEFTKSHFVLDNLSQTEAVKQLNDLYAKREQAKDPQIAQAIDNQIEVIKSQPVEKQPSIQEAVLQNAQKYGNQPQDFNRPEIPMNPLTPNQILERNGMKTANTVGELHDRYIESATKLNELRPELDRTATELDAFKKDARTADFKTDKSGNKTLEGLADIPEAFGHGFGGTMKSIEQGFVNLLGDKQDRIDYAKKRYLEDNILYPTRTKGMATSGSEMIGGVAPYVISTAVLPETALLGHVIINGLTMGASGYGNGYYEMFAKQKQQGASDEEADAIAMQNAKFEGAKETAIGASLPFMGGAGSKLFLAPAEKSAMKQFLATQGVIIPTFTAGKLASNVYQKYGLGEKDVNLGDGLAETAENGLILGAMMEFAHKAPPKLKELYRANLSEQYPSIQQAVDKAVKDGAMDASQGYAFTEKLKRDYAVFNAMPKDITTEQKLAIEPEVKQIIELSSREPSEVESPEVTKDKIVQLQKQVAEKLGTPLTEKEMKSYEKLQEIKGDKEDKLTPSEKLELKHYEKRIKTAEDNDVKLAEEKKVAEAETPPTNVGVEEGSVGVGGDVEIKNEGKAKAPTKESVTERLNINNPFYRKVEDALVKLGLIEKYNPETGTGDVVGGYAQQTSDGGFSVGKMLFSQDGSISYFDGDVKVSFDKNGNVISENTKEAKQKAVSLEIESKKESIANLEKTRDSEAFKYKEVTETDVLGNKKKVKRLKTPQELKESTDKINAAIDKAKSALSELEQSLKETTKAEKETVTETVAEKGVADLPLNEQKGENKQDNKGLIEQPTSTTKSEIEKKTTEISYLEERLKEPFARPLIFEEDYSPSQLRDLRETWAKQDEEERIIIKKEIAQKQAELRALEQTTPQSESKPALRDVESTDMAMGKEPIPNDIKTAIDNGEITREQVDGFIEQDESVITDIERKAESENEAELNSAIDQADKLIGEAVGTTEGEKQPTNKGTSEDKVTGITKAVQEQEWKELGVDSDFANQLSRDWDGTVLKEAKDKIKANPYIAETLAKELNDNPRPTTDTENAILLIEKRRLQNLFDEHYNDTSEDKNPIALLAIQDKLIENMNAIEGAGTKLGQGLNSLKMLMAKDYSLATMLAKKRLANDNKPLTPEVEKQITDLHEKITELQKKFDDYVEQKKKESEITDAENGLNRAKRDVRKNNRNLTREKLKAERDVIVSNIKDKVATLLESAVEKTGGKLNAVENKVNNKEVLSSLSLEISNLVKNLVEDKVLDLADIVDNIHDELKGIIPDLSKREVRDAISGYGKEPQKQTKSEIQSEIDRLKKEAKQLSKQEDIESGKIDEPRLKALKTRTANRIKELQEKIAKGDYSKKEKKVYELDDVALNLKAELDREKAKFSKGLQQDALSKRTLGEKGLDALAQWSRAIKLSGIVTLGKLTAAAAERVVITPAEEAVGGVLSKIFPKLSAKAEREGGINAKIEAQAISKGFMKGMADSWRILTTGESNLDVSYGKQDNLPHSVLDFFGHLHGALKAVPKRIEFERSFAKRMEAQAKKGIDVSNPLVQTKTAIQAYKDSKRAIFMQDNIVASAWSNFIKSLESKNKTTGEDNKVIATIGKTLLPFVKIPTNIVGETLTYAGGSVSGSYKLAKALTKGIENVSPEEADVVLRHLKKGSLGLGLLALGFFNPQAIGGYYQKYEKRREGEPEAGEVELFGHKIPKFLVHNPLLECLQIGATVRRVSDTYTKGKENTKTSGLMAGLLGIADEVPFVKTGESLKGALESEHEATYFLGSYLKGMIDPALLQDIARFTDKDENGKVKKRETDTVLEHIESGLPFLRQSLPEKEQKNRAVTTPLYDEKGKLLQHGRTR